MAVFDSLPALLRAALREGWEDWCTLDVAEQFNLYRAAPMDPAAAARATALHFADLEEDAARQRATTLYFARLGEAAARRLADQ